MNQAHPTPERILQLGLSFWSAKALLSAVELGVFTALADESLEAPDLAKRIGLHPRSTHDFLDALVALGMLERSGNRYRNTRETATFLDRTKPGYMGGILEMANTRLYGFWGSLTEALRTGNPQNEAKSGTDLFETLYADPERLEVFLKGMTGVSIGTGAAIARQFPWARYRTFFDIGAAQGSVPVQIASVHRHLTGGGFDLPPVRPIFERYIDEHGLTERLRFVDGDFFRDPLPAADVLIMGHILHDWDIETKRMLLKKAYDALPQDGALIVYEALIDDERKNNAFGLLMSLNMLIETSGGFDYTGRDCSHWMQEAGFRETRVEHLMGPDSMVVGIK